MMTVKMRALRNFKFAHNGIRVVSYTDGQELIATEAEAASMKKDNLASPILVSKSKKKATKTKGK